MRLIDADELLRRYDEEHEGEPGKARKLILDAPTVEQESVKPFVGNYWKNSMGRCGHCKAPLPALEGLRSKFCWMCERAVKWE